MTYKLLIILDGSKGALLRLLGSIEHLRHQISKLFPVLSCAEHDKASVSIAMDSPKTQWAGAVR
ncbi:hypothetical protein JCM17846_22360 [Iodidimonas nitroreducens]|uniref:Uncharacterized protein n=1 Tax=Iodidimonas nitroreducens TaxID=1236968 RepID=A0A5A7N9Z6_9PROT|nr:hypothetical protein [Iodidimonas nitroreducens]GAK32552.1 hypothetical protein AQ1_00418 [alpha proteobacterium Q-1]GER04554.1 hypothetical protein JCM17846_22360 [Iodidimonas nitroreducens]